MNCCPPSGIRPISARVKTPVATAERSSTLYAVALDRSIQIEKRTVDAKTTRPPQPLTRREKLRLGGFGLLIAVAIVGVTSLFVDVRGLWSQVVETVRPINADEIEVDASAFEPYLTIGERRAVSNPTRIVVTLERSSEYPATEEHLQLACEQSGASLTGRLAVEALARGYVRCELFGAEERYLGSATIRISDLRKKEKIDLGVPLPKKTRVERIVITY